MSGDRLGLLHHIEYIIGPKIVRRGQNLLYLFYFEQDSAQVMGGKVSVAVMYDPPIAKVNDMIMK